MDDVFFPVKSEGGFMVEVKFHGLSFLTEDQRQFIVQFMSYGLPKTIEMVAGDMEWNVNVTFVI